MKACGASGLVFICSDKGGGLSSTARTAVRGASGREPGNVVFYPARRNGDAKRFARALREQVYAAADLREATKG